MRKAQAEAAGHGMSLQDILAGVLEERLASKHAADSSDAWKEFYGAMRHLHDERRKIESLIEEGCEQVRPDDWR